MRTLMRHASTLGLILLLHSWTFGNDWPQYRGPAGDGKSSESVTLKPWQAGEPKMIWKVPAPRGFSSPSVAGGRVFTLVTRNHQGEDLETCVALDAQNGEELWNVPLSSSDYEHDGGNAGARDNRGGDGPRTTPTTDGERVFVYDGRLVLSCLSAASGELIWRRDVVKEFAGRTIKWYNATSPLLDGDVLYISGGGPGQTFLAVDKASGDVIWRSGDEVMTHATPHLVTIDNQKQVVYFMQSGLVSVNAETGNELWRAQFPFSVSTAASPISSGNRVYCSAGYGVGAGLFEVTGSREADELWFKPNELMNHWSTPVVHDGHIYGIFEFKKYGRAPLQCVDLATGEIRWSEPGFGPGNCILVGDKLVVLSDAGQIVLVKADPKAYSELGRKQAVSGKCWSTPAYSNGRIYVRSTEEAACFEVPVGPSID